MTIGDAGLNSGFYRSDKVAPAYASVFVVLYSTEQEKALEKVKAAGGCIVQDISSFPGGRRFHFSDPNGDEYAAWAQ